jgi:hypothetical protein
VIIEMKRVEQVPPRTGVLAQTMYKHVNKYKNDKIKGYKL